MTWEDPRWLVAWLLVPLWLIVVFRHRASVRQANGVGARARWLWVDAQGERRPPSRSGDVRIGAWAALGLTLGVAALAGPQWGEKEEVRFDQAREVLIALDLSRSMLAEDVPPSRLTRAKLLVESTLDELAGERVGLLLFAGTAFLQSPLSSDHEVLRELLPVLEPGYLPTGGTDYSAMIDATLEAFSQTGAADRFLVVLSDGEAQGFDDAEGALALSEAGIRVIALGIGTEAGALIPDGRGGIVKDDRGAAVLSRLERPSLVALARETDGVYVDAARWIDLPRLVEETVSQAQLGSYIEERGRSPIARFQWLMGPALLFLLFSYGREMPTTVRARVLSGRSLRGPAAVADVTRVIAVWSIIFAASALAPIPGWAVVASEDEQQPDPLVTLISTLSARQDLSAVDYQALASATVAAGQQRRTEGAGLATGTIDDGLVAVDVGERLDVEAADWAALRADLEALRIDPDSSSREQDSSSDGQTGESGGGGQGENGGAAGDSAAGESSDPGDSASEDGDGESEGSSGSDTENDAESSDTPGGGSGESGSGSSTADPSEATGEDDSSGESSGETQRGDPTPMADPAAGMGELAASPEEKDTATPDPDGAEGQSAESNGESGQSPESRWVGGDTHSGSPLIEDRPELAGAVGRVERVREGDSPGVLFERMNEADGEQRDPSAGATW